MAGSFPVADIRYTSFDGATSVTTRTQRPDRYKFWDVTGGDEVTISRGAGLSYVAASFSDRGKTTEHCAFNRILSFAENERMIHVEAGITLGELYDFLTPRGLFLPVQPGYPTITVGGCAASDVHGKNQFRDGTFINHVKEATLFHARHGFLRLSPAENADLFRLTCGGYGLTGNLVSLKIALKPFLSGVVRMRTTPLDDIHDLPKFLQAAAARSELVFTWHDFTAKGKGFGQGVLREGEFVAPAELGNQPQDTMARPIAHPLRGTTRGNWQFPFFNSLTTRPFNHLYHFTCRKGHREKLIPLFEFLFPVYNKQAYFKLFGSRGFIEYQTVIPFERFSEYVDRIRERLRQSPVPITLASAKLFAGERELLRFTGNGISFALNFPRTDEGTAFAGFLDDLVNSIGALPNLIKDSRLSAKTVRATYAGYDAFRERLKTFDPERRYRSHFSERLEL